MRKTKKRKMYRTIYKVAYKLNQIDYQAAWKRIKEFLYLALLLYATLSMILALPLCWLLFGY